MQWKITFTSSITLVPFISCRNLLKLVMIVGSTWPNSLLYAVDLQQRIFETSAILISFIFVVESLHVKDPRMTFTICKRTIYQAIVLHA